MYPPEIMQRHLALEKQRRLREDVLIRLHEKKKIYPDYALTEETIKSCVRGVKVSLTKKMNREKKLIESGVLPYNYTTKRKKICQQIERQFAHEMKLILKLTDLKVPKFNKNHVYVNSHMRMFD